MLQAQPPQVAGPLHNDLHRRPASSRSESKRRILTGKSVPRNEAAGNHSFLDQWTNYFIEGGIWRSHTKMTWFLSEQYYHAKGEKVFRTADPRCPQDPHMGLVFVTWAARLLKNTSHTDLTPVNLLRQGGKCEDQVAGITEIKGRHVKMQPVLPEAFWKWYVLYICSILLDLTRQPSLKNKHANRHGMHRPPKDRRITTRYITEALSREMPIRWPDPGGAHHLSLRKPLCLPWGGSSY